MKGWGVPTDPNRHSRHAGEPVFYTLVKQEKRFVTWKEQQLSFLMTDLFFFFFIALFDEYEYCSQVFKYDCEYFDVIWQVFEHSCTQILM